MVLILFSCHRHIMPDKPLVVSVPPPVAVHDSVVVVPDVDPGRPLQIAGFEKSPCFGSCPVFQVKIYSDGTAIWKGERYVERIGTFHAVVTPEWVAGLWKEADEAGFFKFSERYPATGARLPDLPTTTVMLVRERMRRQVADNADAPLALQRFEKQFLLALDKLDWKPAGH
jgi:hypothetical protein